MEDYPHDGHPTYRSSLPTRYDPLAPDCAHLPADGSDGVVVGDDTETMPAVVEPVTPARQWGWLLAVVTWLLVLASLVALAAVGWRWASPPRRPQFVVDVPGLDVRASLPDRCCARSETKETP